METWIENGKKFVSYTSEELENHEDQTDWEAIKNMTEEDIQAGIASDPDAFELTEEDFATAKITRCGGPHSGAG